MLFHRSFANGTHKRYTRLALPNDSAPERSSTNAFFEYVGDSAESAKENERKHFFVRSFIAIILQTRSRAMDVPLRDKPRTRYFNLNNARLVTRGLSRDLPSSRRVEPYNRYEIARTTRSKLPPKEANASAWSDANLKRRRARATRNRIKLVTGDIKKVVNIRCIN